MSQWVERARNNDAPIAERDAKTGSFRSVDYTRQPRNVVTYGDDFDEDAPIGSNGGQSDEDDENA